MSLRQINAWMPNPFETDRDMPLECFRARLRIAGLSSEAIANEERQARSAYEAGVNFCESPIEVALLRALVIADFANGTIGHTPVHVDLKAMMPEAPVVIVPQMKFGAYRLDFGLAVRAPHGVIWFAAECDGAGFHAAKPDTLRDGVLASFGVETIRLSGREINRSPYTSAAKVALAVWTRLSGEVAQ